MTTLKNNFSGGIITITNCKNLIRFHCKYCSYRAIIDISYNVKEYNCKQCGKVLLIEEHARNLTNISSLFSEKLLFNRYIKYLLSVGYIVTNNDSEIAHLKNVLGTPCFIPEQPDRCSFSIPRYKKYIAKKIIFLAKNLDLSQDEYNENNQNISEQIFSKYLINSMELSEDPIELYYTQKEKVELKSYYFNRIEFIRSKINAF